MKFRRKDFVTMARSQAVYCTRTSILTTWNKSDIHTRHFVVIRKYRHQTVYSMIEKNMTKHLVSGIKNHFCFCDLSLPIKLNFCVRKKKLCVLRKIVVGAWEMYERQGDDKWWFAINI